MVGKCQGRIVSEEEAERIKARRVERVQRVLQPPTANVPPNHKLTGVGTGFFVAMDGKLLTNEHVVSGCAVVTIDTTIGSKITAEVVATDVVHDLALLHAQIAAPSIAVFHDAANIQVGRPITLIGYPNQGLTPIVPLSTNGSLLGFDLKSPELSGFVLKADVRRGNSGGPVLDADGLVIGVIHSKVDTVKIYEITKKFVENVGFAVSNLMILRFLDTYQVKYQTGVSGDALTDEQIVALARLYVVRVGCWK
ncbi:MAG: trypsin-like peptidase domain-containing protein [Proteobacteria bacterium]|nr:trypsin-like peptidase domain-containing protein [Pseudomonadota bacterium]